VLLGAEGVAFADAALVAAADDGGLEGERGFEEVAVGDVGVADPVQLGDPDAGQDAAVADPGVGPPGR